MGGTTKTKRTRIYLAPDTAQKLADLAGPDRTPTQTADALIHMAWAKRFPKGTNP